MGNRFSFGAIALTIALSILSWPSAGAAQAATPPDVKAASSILLDVADGRVLFERAADERRAIASTTKILTALVVLEKSKLSDVVEASRRAEEVGADDPLVTELELTAGERLTVEEMLYGLLLLSANDAAVALAEHVGGSESGFAKMMMDRARLAGAKQSSFVNPHGFDHPDQYSTARDLALITLQALRRPDFRQIVGTAQKQIPWSGHPSPRTLKNRNQLLGAYPGADGIKTGQTRASGKSLVASASRGSESRMSIVLSSPDPIADSKALLDFGFGGFIRTDVVTKDVAWGFVTSGSGRSMTIKPRRSVSVLVEQGTDPPVARFRPEDKILVVSPPGSPPIEVPASLACLQPCITARTGTFGKLLGIITSMIRWF